MFIQDAEPQKFDSKDTISFLKGVSLIFEKHSTYFSGRLGTNLMEPDLSTPTGTQQTRLFPV